MTKPRGAVLVRRFLAGASITALFLSMPPKMRVSGEAMKYIEDCIRRALNRKRGKR